MTRLEMLCKLHNQQGGTIHEFNRLYKTDFILMSEDKFNVLINVLAKQRKVESINNKMSQNEITNYFESLKLSINNQRSNKNE